VTTDKLNKLPLSTWRQQPADFEPNLIKSTIDRYEKDGASTHTQPAAEASGEHGSGQDGRCP
jgi:hypothetical protein